jgi:hypothetical protein
MGLKNRAFQVRLIAAAAWAAAKTPQRHISREAAKEKGKADALPWLVRFFPQYRHTSMCVRLVY